MSTTNQITKRPNQAPAQFMRIANESDLFKKGRTLWYHYSSSFGYERELVRSNTQRLAQGCGLPVSFVERAINHYLTH
ncbi:MULTISPECIES: hypothetical protein [Providencia]|uniref:Uncharacterized protein n=1 Tax=Morganella morganii TaxID=582 RepID=A0AAI9HSI8_MORMO|nr:MULTISPECIES: hypothetical protein [Providencia]EKW8761333.1 hypothetical protein [Morganella morganii]ELI9034703.1 hypothetical protein [Morganella morganii]MBX6987125.1 hypothetical protein [Providencia rettgeri]MBX6987975.1 hypothetical protein [Providencia rettgeri]TCG14999.1 hypothetical protein EX224_08475 [Providencia rettgeri]